MLLWLLVVWLWVYVMCRVVGVVAGLDTYWSSRWCDEERAQIYDYYWTPNKVMWHTRPCDWIFMGELAYGDWGFYPMIHGACGVKLRAADVVARRRRQSHTMTTTNQKTPTIATLHI
jgi:hypothetical protein